MSKRQRNRSDQRARILDAARALFADRGFDDVTMTEIAGKAGVARATVFNYFPSKVGLVEAITEDVLAYFHAMLERGIADDTTPVPSLVRAFFAHMGTGIEVYQRFYQSAFREVMKVQVGLDPGGGEMRRHGLVLLERLMARGQDRGELRRGVPPRDLAGAFDSLANGTIVHWLYEDATGSLRERMERAAEIFLGGVAEARWAEPPARVPDLAPLGWDPAGRGREPTPRRS
jgi:AcrR family transcriptional regulator